MRTALRVLWRWGWLPGLAFLALCAHWAGNTAHHYVTFGIGVDTMPFSVGLREAGRREWGHLLRRFELAFAPRVAMASEPGVAVVHLDVAHDALARLDSELPYSGRKFVPARLRVDDYDHAVEVRYRGDTYVHWGGYKKSFRVRTSKEAMFDGMRTFNLIVPKHAEQLNNYLGYRLARQLGLLAPRVELARVNLNGSYHGFFVLTEQISKSLLLRNDRLPGPVYSGELLLRDAWRGVPNELFSRASLWEQSVSSRYPRDHGAPIEELIAILNTPADERALERFENLVDLEAFARLSALEVLTQSHHNDGFHNWRLYWDPWRRKFEPIVWDPMAWCADMRPLPGDPIDLHPVYTPLHSFLHMHAGFLAARHRVLRALFDSGGDQVLLAELARARSAIGAALAEDPHLVPPDDAAVSAALDSLTAFVERVLGDVRRAVMTAPGDLRWRPPMRPVDPLLLQLTTDRPGEGVVLGFARPVAPKRVLLRTDTSTRTTSHDLAGRWRAEGNSLFVDVPLMSELGVSLRWREGMSIMRRNRRVPVPTSFEIVVEGVDMRDLRTVADADGEREFARDGSLVPIPVRRLHALVPRSTGPPRRFTGTVEVTGVLELDENVEIEPGTTFSMAPGASIRFGGRVVAVGQQQRPIRFVAARAEGAPWGVVALEGAAANGSRFEHCEFAGGSVRETRIDAYTASLSIHGVDDVVIRSSTLRSRHGTAAHFVNSAVTLEDVRFEEVSGDAINCAGSEVVVGAGRFERCGGSALAARASRVFVRECEAASVGNAAVSARAGSRVIVIGGVFEACRAGCVAAERSVVAVSHSTFARCQVAVEAVAGSWIHEGGGRIIANRCVVHGCTTTAVADEHSGVTLGDCALDDPASSDPRVRRIACDTGSEARLPIERLPADLTIVGEAAVELWSSYESQHRGAPMQTPRER